MDVVYHNESTEYDWCMLIKSISSRNCSSGEESLNPFVVVRYQVTTATASIVIQAILFRQLETIAAIVAPEVQKNRHNPVISHHNHQDGKTPYYAASRAATLCRSLPHKTTRIIWSTIMLEVKRCRTPLFFKTKVQLLLSHC